jgi:hypothetical protein
VLRVGHCRQTNEEANSIEIPSPGRRYGVVHSHEDSVFVECVEAFQGAGKAQLLTHTRVLQVGNCSSSGSSSGSGDITTTRSR